ncbi:MAG: hypothetical protein QXP58_04305, partial [Thermoprotei archaeon]
CISVPEIVDPTCRHRFVGFKTTIRGDSASNKWSKKRGERPIKLHVSFDTKKDHVFHDVVIH